MRTPKKSKRPQKPRAPLNHLDEIHDAFADGLALVTTAHEVITQSSAYGPEETVLRLGVEALSRIYDQLDRANIELSSSKKTSKKAGGSHES